ncbi:hypothetical protein [Modestobacter versicolor]|uniref:Uncharacterized protein n=1 Tax=Modestobacter versicolor TaxID=429133 RepID=A0A323V404_9ACTN|nr:hypothetical protein [Modestobacter versicolor]MBB3676843.1 hypothetical protein [Modestobacter versicolor]PZA19515.1 hypothetical protein DMO24_20320 [Modestobacter versicolor]
MTGLPDPEAAAAQLDVLDADRAALADRIVQPWWWDVALGLGFAGLVASYSSHRIWVIGAAVVVFLALVRLLGVVYRRSTGVWWDAREVGPVQGRVRRAARWWGPAFLGAMGVGAGLEFLLDVRGAMVVTGVVLGTAVALSSRWVSRTYAAGLRAGA